MYVFITLQVIEGQNWWCCPYLEALQSSREWFHLNTFGNAIWRSVASFECFAICLFYHSGPFPYCSLLTCSLVGSSRAGGPTYLPTNIVCWMLISNHCCGKTEKVKVLGYVFPLFLGPQAPQRPRRGAWEHVPYLSVHFRAAMYSNNQCVADGGARAP